MKSRRPECGDSNKPAIPNDTALYLIRSSVARRRMLIYGRLHDGQGHHCALGCFWDDTPGAAIHGDLVEEVAAVNDYVPASATPQERWKKVMAWLNWKVKVLANGETARARRASR